MKGAFTNAKSVALSVSFARGPRRRPILFGDLHLIVEEASFII